MSYNIIILLMILTCFEQTVTGRVVYHITDDNVISCNDNETCLSLSQYAANPVDSSTSLVLLEGNHSLDINLNISNMDSFSIHSNSSTSINCRGNSHITLLSIQNITISNVTFNRCTINITNSLTGLIISNSMFDGQDIRGTALVLINVAYTEINKSSFVSNKIGTVQTLPSNPTSARGLVGGAVLIIHCNVIVSQSRFEDNNAPFGGAICAEQRSNITIVSSSFVNNHGSSTQTSVGGAICSFHSNIIINESHFANNSAHRGGAIATFNTKVSIYCRSNMANMTETNSMFISNNAHLYGGAMYFYYSNARVEECGFSNNYCYYHGGALYGHRGMIDISSSIFILNNAKSYGGATYFNYSSARVESCLFRNNNSATRGGAIYTYKGNVNISSSRFSNNNAVIHGGAVYGSYGMVYILTSVYTSNRANSFGGALYFNRTTASIASSRYSNNTAMNGGAQGGETATVDIFNSTFNFNTADEWGGVMDNKHGSKINIRSSRFENNKALLFQGGVVRAWYDVVMIVNSTFHYNTAFGSSGGALSGLDSTFIIKSSRFFSNSAEYYGGALYIIGSLSVLYIVEDDANHVSKRSIDITEFINNSATKDGAAVYTSARTLIINGSLLVSNNFPGENYAFYIALVTTGQISGNMSFLNNQGSLAIASSNIELTASGEFFNCSGRSRGALVILLSTVYLNGSYQLEQNYAENGAGIYAVESKLYINAPVAIVNNSATETGGGVYLYQSDLICGQNCLLILQMNQATNKGGGIHAISSLIELSARELARQPKWMQFIENTAKQGGAIFMEANSKLYIIQYSNRFTTERISDYTITFRSNSAEYGGTIYVDDYTNSIGVCNNVSNSPTNECFFQVLSRYLTNSGYAKHLEFLNNVAVESGSILYGGLLDRCTRSPFTEIEVNSGSNSDGLSYFEAASSVTRQDNSSISSHPVRLHLCNDNQPVRLKKGEQFTLLLTAMDQIGHPVNATVSGYLMSTESDLIQGQVTYISESCAEVTLQILSPYDSEQLTLYSSDGPCKDASLSAIKVNIEFLPCTCPIGFQPSSETTTCTCQCNDDIKKYVTCNSSTEIIMHSSDSWISYVNGTGYIIYLHCPFDYCLQEETVFINLSQINGSNSQCNFNRSGLLCGSCQSGLSLSLGSSQCLSCPRYWPATFVFLTLAAILAGITLVALLLILNMTVAVGSLNGLIFYANIVAVNKSIFLPFSKSNFITVFISWLNLELGIDTCYFPGVDAYIKTWLQLIFPAYVILLVIMIIIISQYSTRFSRIIGRKNPVATLATLILLSYAKFLQTIITALSLGIIHYCDGHQDNVWLPDATVNYLRGKHVVLFITAIFILTLGLAYTVLLFCWHWFPSNSCPRWRIFSAIRNPKFRSFIEMYTVPYTPKHRYWTGMLLLVRIILYLVATLNVSGGPKIVLASVTIIVGCIVTYKSFIGRVYIKWEIDLLETLFYFNILFLTTFTWLALDTNIDQKAIAYISVILSLVFLIIILLGHTYVHTKLFSKLGISKHYLALTHLLRRTQRDEPPTQPPTDNVDDIHGLHSLLDSLDDVVDTDRSQIRKVSIPVSFSEIEAPRSMTTQETSVEAGTLTVISESPEKEISISHIEKRQDCQLKHNDGKGTSKQDIHLFSTQGREEGECMTMDVSDSQV